MFAPRAHASVSIAACAATTAWRAVIQANPDVLEAAPIKRADPGAA